MTEKLISIVMNYNKPFFIRLQETIKQKPQDKKDFNVIHIKGQDVCYFRVAIEDTCKLKKSFVLFNQ